MDFPFTFYYVLLDILFYWPCCRILKIRSLATKHCSRNKCSSAHLINCVGDELTFDLRPRVMATESSADSKPKKATSSGKFHSHVYTFRYSRECGSLWHSTNYKSKLRFKLDADTLLTNSCHKCTSLSPSTVNEIAERQTQWHSWQGMVTCSYDWP